MKGLSFRSGLIAAFCGLAGFALSWGAWHLYIDHAQLHAVVAVLNQSIAQAQQAQQAQAQPAPRAPEAPTRPPQPPAK